MTIGYEYYSNEGGEVPSAVATKEAESKIINFDAERRLRELRELRKERGRMSLATYELKQAA